MTGLAAFLAAAVRGDSVLAGTILTPELETTLWRDFSYTEYAAEGFAMLGDADNASKWLERAVELGAGYYRGLSSFHAVWRPWLEHPQMAPILRGSKSTPTGTRRSRWRLAHAHWRSALIRIDGVLDRIGRQVHDFKDPERLHNSFRGPRRHTHFRVAVT